MISITTYCNVKLLAESARVYLHSISMEHILVRLCLPKGLFISIVNESYIQTKEIASGWSWGWLASILYIEQSYFSYTTYKSGTAHVHMIFDLVDFTFRHCMEDRTTPGLTNLTDIRNVKICTLMYCCPFERPDQFSWKFGIKVPVPCLIVFKRVPQVPFYNYIQLNYSIWFVRVHAWQMKNTIVPTPFCAEGVVGSD